VTALLGVAIERARREVANHPNHELSFRTRKQLLLEFGPTLRDEDGRAAICPGLIRRARLCFDVVRRVLPIWEVEYNSVYPRLMLDVAEGYLTGDVSRAFLRKMANGFAGVMSNPKVGAAALVGDAAVHAVMVAYLDETLEPGEGVTERELYEPEDPDAYDSPILAAGAYAGGMPWMDGFDRDRYREFWYWYLDEAAPRAYASVPAP
jgi:hypothetical protein